MLEYSRKYKAAHPEKQKEYLRRYRSKKKAKKEQKSIPDISKAKALFRDPAKAEHLQWLVNHALAKQKEVV